VARSCRLPRQMLQASYAKLILLSENRAWKEINDSLSWTGGAVTLDLQENKARGCNCPFDNTASLNRHL